VPDVPAEPSQRSGFLMGARRTAGVVAGVVAVGATAAAITVFNLRNSDDDAEATDSLPATTAEVTKETLIDRENHDGTLGHGNATTVSAHGSGTVTWLPPEGATITRGKPIFKLDNKSVTLLYGALPAYRTLTTGIVGADVKEFEQNLWKLGYRGFTVDTTYSRATASAVKTWQGDLHLPKTGLIDPSNIVYAADAVRVDSLTSEVGSQIGPGAPVEKITGTRPLVTVDLDSTSERLANQGAAVQVTIPSGKRVGGTIIKVTTIVDQGSGNEPDTTKIEVTIRFAAVVPTSGAAIVTVAFAAGERKNVLAVPVAALLALSEGGYGVQVVEGTTTRIVAVQTGLFADGKAEVTGSGLEAGMKVGMPS
jgi:peptidoglycan hydrolase-like protein with peptidoglycan-binding domain